MKDIIRDLGTWAILHAWVLDMDISEFFDTKDYELLLKAIRIHVTEKCVSIIERWLRVSYEDQDGNLTAHKMGVPQGLYIPVLANLFLHYVFDRYTDDIICYCQFEIEARSLQIAIVECFQD